MANTQITPQITGAIQKVCLSNSGKCFIITMKNGDTYLFEPTKELIRQYYENTLTDEEYRNYMVVEFRNSMPELSQIHWIEARMIAKFYQNRGEWVKVSLKEPALTQRVAKLINRKVFGKFGKGLFTITNIVKNYTQQGSTFCMVGVLGEVFMNFEGATLRKCAEKAIEVLKEKYSA